MSDTTASAPADGGVEMGPTTGPPVGILAGAAGCVLLGVVLLVAGSFALHVLGYLAASFVTIGLVGVFRRVDLTRRLDPGYRAQPGLSRVLSLLLVGAFVVAGLNVWAIATELAS